MKIGQTSRNIGIELDIVGLAVQGLDRHAEVAGRDGLSEEVGGPHRGKELGLELDQSTGLDGEGAPGGSV
jgi:hypothetical protein